MRRSIDYNNTSGDQETLFDPRVCGFDITEIEYDHF